MWKGGRKGLTYCKGNEGLSYQSVAWEFNIPSLHVCCRYYLLRDRTGRNRIRGRQRSQVEVRSSAFSAISALLNLTSKPCPDSGGSAVCSYAEHRLSASLSSHGGHQSFQDLAEFSSFETDIVACSGIKRGRCCRWKGSAQHRSSVDEGMVENIRSACYSGV